MASRTISQLDITENVIGSEYLLIDDTERTTRTTINTVTDALSTAIVQSIQSTTIVAVNSAWDSTYTTVHANSANWSLSSNPNVDTLVMSNSAVWDSTYTIIQANSASWTVDVSPIDIITENYNISAGDNGKQFTYTSTNSVTAFITEDINIPNFTTTFSQLDYGSVNIKIDSNYTTASAIYINDVDYTITKGASINIKRVADNQFLITPVFFSLAH